MRLCVSPQRCFTARSPCLKHLPSVSIRCELCCEVQMQQFTDQIFRSYTWQGLIPWLLWQLKSWPSASTRTIAWWRMIHRKPSHLVTQKATEDAWKERQENLRTKSLFGRKNKLLCWAEVKEGTKPWLQPLHSKSIRSQESAVSAHWVEWERCILC